MAARYPLACNKEQFDILMNYMQNLKEKIKD